METLFAAIDLINSTLLSVPMLLALLGLGVLFTFWSGFGQYRALTHGVQLIRGKGGAEISKGPGALTHFQALTAALSGTVGLGNIAGVAIAIELGGPGAVFWMWVVGVLGMAIKATEVTLSMLYRDVSNPNDPHGGTMYVCREGFAVWGKTWGKIGKVAGALFAVAMLVFAITGGNMFQAWSVADTTRNYFGVPEWVTGLILATLVGIVILGGIKRIGSVVDKLVPLMCGAYVLCGIYVLVHNASALPEMFKLIFASAFSPAQATGAFAGGTLGSAFLFGMKRALFSSESGLGTAPIAHSAVKTSEPVTEGVVAGLEPFIDTLVVCTITALVILSAGVWNRGPALRWDVSPTVVKVGVDQWAAQPVVIRGTAEIKAGDAMFLMMSTPTGRARMYGELHAAPEVAPDALRVDFTPISSPTRPDVAELGLFAKYQGATLAAKSFDSAHAGLGKWMVTLTVWLFALSTMITYGYYAEQGVCYLGLQKFVVPFRIGWTLLSALTCLGFITTIERVDALSTVGMGLMLAINLPTMLLLGSRAMGAWHDYFRRRALARA